MARKMEISSKTIVFTVFFLISLQLLWTLREIIYALFLGFILMSALKPVVEKLVAFKFPRPIAVFVALAATITLVVSALTILLPPLISEIVVFISNLPGILANTFPFLTEYLKFESTIQFLPDITQNFFKVATGAFSNFLFIISVVFFSFYFLLEERLMESFLEKFLSPKEVSKILSVSQKIELRMGAWMRGELILMLVIGIATYIGLKVLGIKFALSLAFIAGLLEVIPIIGPIVASLPAFVVASSTSFVLGGATLVLYVIIQQLENNVVVPYVMSKTAGIHPITTLIALAIGAKLGGLMGAIIAVPTALFIETVVSSYMKEDA